MSTLERVSGAPLLPRPSRPAASSWARLLLAAACCLSSRVSATTVHRRDLPEVRWERFGGSAYLFAIDAHREVDTTRAAASVICRSMGAALVSINSDEELTFLQERIRKLVESQGQQFAQEQWWTGGRRKDGSWVWETPHEEKPISFGVETDGMPVHQNDVTHYVVLEHVPSQWKLRTLPENYQLRYICEKGDPNWLYPVVYPSADTLVDPTTRPIEERMLANLFREYDPDARGNRRPDAPVTVNLQFVLLRIQELNEKNMVLTCMGMLIADWRDDRLTWNPTEYENVTSLVVRSERLWLPELAIINAAEETMMEDFTKIRAVVYYDGRVHWEPGGNFRTTCDINIHYFPFDWQHCEVVIGAWVYHSAKMNVTNVSADVNTDNYTLNGEWELVGTDAFRGEAELPCCPGMSYSHVRFGMAIRRRHLFYVVNIVIPCVLLSALVLAVFWVPPDAGERLSAGISVLLAFIVFLLMMADTVPRTSLDVPVLIIYLTCTMTLVGLSIMWTVVVINLHTRQTPLPPWTRRLLALRRRSKFFRSGYHQGASSGHMTPDNDVTSCGDKLRVIQDVKVGATPCRKPGVSFRDEHNAPLTSEMTTEAALRVPLKRETPPYIPASIAGPPEPPDPCEETKEIVTILDRIVFFCMFLAMLLSSVFILFIPWYSAGRE